MWRAGGRSSRPRGSSRIDRAPAGPHPLREGRRLNISPASSIPHPRGAGCGASRGPPPTPPHKEKTDEQSHRHRPRHHQFLRRHHGRRRGEGAGERGGRAHDPLHGRLQQDRRAAGGTERQAPGRHQPHQHPLCRQAPDRPQVRRRDGAEGEGPGPLRHRPRRQWRRLGRGGRQEVCAAADQRQCPDQDEGHGRGLSRREGDAGRHHRARLFQRRPAPGDQGGRRHRGPRSPAHHQRADGRGAGLWHGQEGHRHHRGL